MSAVGIVVCRASCSETEAPMTVWRAPDGRVVASPDGDLPAGLAEGPALPLAPPTHRHYKGGLYALLFADAIRSDDKSPVVVYQHDGDGRVWVRPAGMWGERLPGGEPRFAALA